MACIFRKMPYVFLSINKQNFSYAIKKFSAESIRIYFREILILFALNNRHNRAYREIMLFGKKFFNVCMQKLH